MTWSALGRVEGIVDPQIPGICDRWLRRGRMSDAAVPRGAAFHRMARAASTGQFTLSRCCLPMIQRTAAKTKASDEGHPGLTCLESKTVESGGANGRKEAESR
ncbi:hypothetical protein [Acidipila rosea]|uniref:hypothetical protein n=1 Tax=Acidipila rosea TaxID=768535 RepID=UPI00104B2C62|nr:hypothetical protein [Acidipila rosea]